MPVAAAKADNRASRGALWRESPWRPGARRDVLAARDAARECCLLAGLSFRDLLSANASPSGKPRRSPGRTGVTSRSSKVRFCSLIRCRTTVVRSLPAPERRTTLTTAPARSSMRVQKLCTGKPSGVTFTRALRLVDGTPSSWARNRRNTGAIVAGFRPASKAAKISRSRPLRTQPVVHHCTIRPIPYKSVSDIRITPGFDAVLPPRVSKHRSASFSTRRCSGRLPDPARQAKPKFPLSKRSVVR